MSAKATTRCRTGLTVPALSAAATYGIGSLGGRADQEVAVMRAHRQDEFVRVGDITAVERSEVRVLFKRATDQQADITRVWDELERAVGSLRSRRFFGVFDGRLGEYRACVEPRAHDEGAALGLEEGRLPGGRYVRARLRGQPPGVYAEIGPLCTTLQQRPDYDESRPSIEFYRRMDEVDVLVPVK